MSTTGGNALRINLSATVRCSRHPTIPEQQAILSSIARSDLPRLNTAISRLEREIALLREYRTRLVADVVTGKLDVRPAALHLPAEAAEAETAVPPEDSPEEAELEPEAIE